MFTTLASKCMRRFQTSPASLISPIRSRKMPKKLPSLSKTQVGEPHASSKLSPSSSELPASYARLPGSSSKLDLGRLVNCHAENRSAACAAPASSSKVPVSSFKLPASGHQSVVDEIAECRDGATASDDRKRAREPQSRCHHTQIPGRNSIFLKRMKSCTRKACERCRERKTSCDENTPCGKCVKSFQHIQAMGELSLFSFRSAEEMCFRSARKQAQRTGRKPSNETSSTPI